MVMDNDVDLLASQYVPMQRPGLGYFGSCSDSSVRLVLHMGIVLDRFALALCPYLGYSSGVLRRKHQWMARIRHLDR
jgi:hypothetical protein